MASLATRGVYQHEADDASNSSEFYDFSLDEIREQLAVLGYRGVPVNKLVEFKRDLDDMAVSIAGSVDDVRPRGRDRFSREEEQGVSDNTLGEEDETDADSTALEWEEANQRCLYISQPHSKRQPTTMGRTNLNGGANLSSASNGAGPIKRKTARKDVQNGGYYTDESSYLEETDRSWANGQQSYPQPARDAAYSTRENFVEDNFDGLASRHARFHDDPVTDVLDYTRQTSALPLSARSGMMRQARSNPRAPAYPKSDPVSRFHRYQAAWSAQRAPGERDHRQLRWAIKESMMVHEVPSRRPVTPVQPNEYVPPTDKHRNNLRWNVRQELAHQGFPTRDY